MTTQIVNSDPTALRQIKVDNSQIKGRTLANVAIGDVLNFSVKQGPAGQQRMLALQGQLINAQLPSNLEVGDNIVATVSEAANNQLLLKILQISKPNQAAGISQTNSLRAQLEELIKASNVPALQALPIFSLPDDLSTLDPRKVGLQKLLSVLNSTEKLTDPRVALSELISTADGTLASSLKESAALIRSFVGQQPLTTEEKLLRALKGELKNLLESSDDNFESAKLINLMTGVLGKELTPKSVTLISDLISDRFLHAKDDKLGASAEKERQILVKVLGELRKASSEPANSRESIEKALSLITAYENENGIKKIDAKTVSDLQQLAMRLDQMAGIQETLTQLNPVMQALGEPALLLFPFLFQGLVSHSEITVDSRSGKKKKGESESEDSKGSKRNTEPYQRIQVTVPLPSMGLVDVDIAHRQKEILVRLTVEKNDVGSFLLEHLEHLSPILRNLGFESAELVAHIGRTSDQLPAWSLGLQSSRAIIA